MSNIKIIKPYSRISDKEISLAGALAKEGRTKVPGSEYALTPVKDAKGNVITGIDENALSLSKIKDSQVLETERARLKALRERLEGELNENLSPSSAFWLDPEYGKANELFYLKDGENVFDMNNPMDVVNFNWLTNVPIIVRSLDELESGKIDPTTISFYVYETDVQSTKEFQRRNKDKASFTKDPIKEFERVTGYTPEVLNIKLLIKQLLDERILKMSGNSVLEGSNLIAKSVEDFEIQLAENPEQYIIFEEKAKSKKAYVDNI